ncbi:MAG: hypothetical protein ACRD2J_07510 [Thermoanaerobaculia bacterium]
MNSQRIIESAEAAGERRLGPERRTAGSEQRRELAVARRARGAAPDQR